MAQQHISYGDHVNDPSADSRRDAFRKVESNFNDLYGKRADDTCNVVDFEGCDPSGANDSTAAIQRAAAQARGALRFAPGRYHVSDTTLIAAGTRVFSDGGATIFTTGMARMTETVDPEVAAHGAAFCNARYNAGSIIDKDITIEGLAFDWGNNPGSNSHILRFCRAGEIKVIRCRFTGTLYGDALAVIGCDDVEAIHNYAEGFYNCGLDAWQGPTRHRFNFNTLVCGGRDGQSINLNGLGPVGDAETATDFEIIGNTIKAATGKLTGSIDVMTLGSGSSVVKGTIAQNRMFADRSAGGYGIVGRGTGGQFDIDGNMIVGATPTTPIALDVGNGGAPTDCTVTRNFIINPDVTNGLPFGHRAAIGLAGDSHIVAHNQIVGGDYDWLIWSEGANNIIGQNQGANGRLGRCGDNGINRPLVFDADTAAHLWRISALRPEAMDISGLPTSPTGLRSGTVWRDNRTDTLRYIP